MYKCGDYVNYRGHGVCKIEDVFTAVVQKQTVTLLRLKTYDDCLITLTLDNATQEKLRRIVTPEGAERIIQEINHYPLTMPGSWILRSKVFSEMINSGDIHKLASAYKSMYIKLISNSKICSNGPELFAKAEQFLLSELSVATGLGHDEIKEKLSEKLSSVNSNST